MSFSGLVRGYLNLYRFITLDFTTLFHEDKGSSLIRSQMVTEDNEQDWVGSAGWMTRIKKIT